jgi:hypothetical protein
MQLIRQNLLVTLSLLCVFLVVIAIFAAQKKEYFSEEVHLDEYFLGEIEGRLADIASVAVYKKGQVFKARSLEGGKWVLSSKNNYPIDIQKIRKIVLDAASLKLVEKKTSNPERFKTLSVETPKEEESEGIRIIFYDKEAEALADFIVGKARRTQTNVNASQIYVRKTNENQVWLVSGAISVDLSAKTLLGSERFKVDATRIKSISRKFLTEAKDYTIAREETGGGFEFVKPKNVSLGEAGKASLLIISQALEEIDFESVKTSEEVDFVRKQTITTNYKTFDGLQMTVKAYNDGKYTWVRLSAKALDDTQEEAVKEINEVVEGWSYAVKENIGKALTMTLKDLVNEAEKE